MFEECGNHEFIDDDGEVTLKMTFYLTAVSPNPRFMNSCNNGDNDCNVYLVNTLISHPLEIIFSEKCCDLISSANNILLQSFTNTIISAQFFEEVANEEDNYNTSYFELRLLTSVPYFMYLDNDNATLLSPSESDIELNNGNTDFIKTMSVIERREDYIYGNDNCWTLTDSRCLQQFSIVIEIVDCPHSHP